MSLAREMVANGVVPPPEALLVEGMFSEHDLPLSGDPCSRTLCLRGALGWESGDGWIQIGLSSNVDMETYRRPSLGVVLLVDVSGSMGWTYGEYGKPAAVTHDLLLGLAEGLEGRDAVGIATFNAQAHRVLDFVPGNSEDVEDAIRKLGATGSTNMEAGLELARDMFAEADLRTQEKRVILITDAQPNVGATGPRSFLQLAGTLKSRGIGLTVIGAGMGLDPKVMESMVNLRGGNGFGIQGVGEVPGFLDDNWPWMVSPIAYDLTATVDPGDGFEVEAGYGFPGRGRTLRAATVFLSRRRGALVLRLHGGELAAFGAGLKLGYVDPAGNPVTENLDLRVPAGAAPDASGRWFEQVAVGTSTALALLVDGMHKAAVLYGSHRSEAVSLMAEVADRFQEDALALAAQGQGDGPDLGNETALARDLLQLMRDGRRQGDLYGGF
jgi:Ca-activated chloride channel family protein